jgi:hypothetical protein
VVPSQRRAVNTDWHVEQLFSILLPYLDHITMVDFITMNKRFCNIASKSIVRQVSWQHKSTQVREDLSKQHQRYWDEKFITSQYRYVDDDVDKSLISGFMLAEGTKGESSLSKGSKSSRLTTKTRINTLIGSFKEVSDLNEQCISAWGNHRSFIYTWTLTLLREAAIKSGNQ